MAKELDPKRCKASVKTVGLRMGWHQCCFAPKKDGFCSKHHPDAERRRAAEVLERQEKAHANSYFAKLMKANARLLSKEDTEFVVDILKEWHHDRLARLTADERAEAEFDETTKDIRRIIKKLNAPR
jgi:hypothetical protein